MQKRALTKQEFDALAAQGRVPAQQAPPRPAPIPAANAPLKRPFDPLARVNAPTAGAAAPAVMANAPAAPRLPGVRTAGSVMEQMGVRPVGEKQLTEANEILNRYRAGKNTQDRRVIECEEWWKLRHWAYMADSGNPEDEKPASAWLFNCIMSKHADAIEGYPEPNIRPREVKDKEEAKRLSAIIPVILEQNDYEETYSAEKWQKLKQGTGITGVFWDRTKLNGLGDISIRKIDALNIFWEPGITDIQKSRNIFTTELMAIDQLKETYPDVLGDASLTGKSFTPHKYVYDDNVDTSDKALVIDWYYHRNQGGKRVLHYVKYVDKYVLFATENDEKYRERGLYDHGLYPFVFDPLFPIEGSPCGYGYIDIGKHSQMTIDRMNQALEKNMLMSSHPRYLIRMGGDVNEKEFADWTRPFVHVPSGTLGDDSLRQIQVAPLSAIYTQIQQSKIEELKETTGNRDASNGGTSSGVTAASAIAAMQEQAGKTSRASTRASYRAYARMVNMVIELIRQFYDMPRQYRITGTDGREEFVSFDNTGLKPQPQGMVQGVDMGLRLPVFDVEVSAQKMTAYTKIAQNEMALQMFQLGILNPQMADQALTLLDIMDFNGKSLVEEKVRRNGGLFQENLMLKQMALTLAMQADRPEVAEALAGYVTGSNQAMGAAGMQQEGSEFANGHEADNVTGLKGKEHPFVEKARKQNNDSTQVT